MEPFEETQRLEVYRRRLGMKHALTNVNGKIWAFIDEEMELEISRDEEQMLTIKLTNQNGNIEVMVSLVYAKCTQGERLLLWDSISDLANIISIPWMIGGDFNVICNEEEKLGGRPVTEAEVRDFNNCINVCNLEDCNFKGSKYTWWNGRTEEECIFKRLDKVLTNDKLQEVFPIIEVEHLIRSGSDHTPVEINLKFSKEEVIKTFRFLNFWLKEESFMETIKEHWKAEFEGDPFALFHHKLKKTKKALSQWSKDTFGNIFQEIATIEEIIKVQEAQFEANPNGSNRETLHQTQAKLKKYLQREEEFWKQKAGMEWFKEGERNTKFFHTIVRGRRSRLRINRIQDEDGDWLEQ
ncbi:uncharacterized protein LOC129869822 [Solanum dulcamara]|uniref:uncharacterized protein LOC129869822 n=1 Tax=Solanum dulcamara TaxID=45834 RepID=UPI002484D8A5|nr:uncharacterized protein LOC129869822 [Solanum dulcamara]